MALNFPERDINSLLDQLLLIGVEKEKVKQQTLAILNWKKGEDCPVSISDLKKGIDGLETLERFNHTRHMIFRDYVGPHSERVTMMHTRSQYIFKYVFGEKYDIPYGAFFASIHDILEGVSPFGDIITTIKETFTPESNAIVKAVESKLAELIMEYFFDSRFTAQPEYVKQAFKDMFYKESLPSQSVSYIDKACDGFMYTFHELVAGNEHFLEYFHNYIARIGEIYSSKKLPEIQELFQFSQEGYREYLEEIHGDDPYLMSHFSKASHLYNPKSFLNQAERISEFFGKCPPEKMKDHLEDDFGFPAYKVWRQTMLLLNPIEQNRTIIRPSGMTLLSVPTKFIIPEKL